MAARGSKKRKLAEEDPGIIGAGRPPSPPSGSRGSADRRLGVVVVADPDSDQGSCDSLLSDATTRLTQDDAAEAASRLLIAVVVRSPEALLAFVQRLTPDAADGYPPGSELWYMAAQLFRDDACWHQFFLDDRHTAESRLRFIQVHCNWLRRGAAPSATAHRYQPVC
uniref:Uncharacterized protein n=1 Tax=Oryza glumipatula TaxID=40148 RepID=A0A0D9ZRP9_9ORYZ